MTILEVLYTKKQANIQNIHNESIILTDCSWGNLKYFLKSNNKTRAKDASL